MRTSSRLIIKNFTSFFFVSWVILILFISIIDLLNSFISYLNFGLSVQKILLAFLYDIPSIMIFSMQFAGLFSSSYIFGKMNSGGELLAFMTLGYSRTKLVLPQVMIAVLLCISNFFIKETWTIDTSNKRKKILEAVQSSRSDSFVVFKGEHSIFYAEKYIEEEETFENIIIMIFTPDQRLLQRVDARYGTWSGKNWNLTDARVLNIDNTIDAGYLQEMVWDGQPSIGEIGLSIKSEYDTTIKQAYQQIQFLKDNNMTYREELLELVKRFTAPLAIILYTMSPIVLKVSKTSGIIFSTMIHLIVASMFTIVGMISGISAKNGSINIYYAAVIPFLFLSFSIFAFSSFKDFLNTAVDLISLSNQRLIVKVRRLLGFS